MGIVKIESMVDIATFLLTYEALQSYFSANIVAEDAAGVDARIRITYITSFEIGSPITARSFIMKNTMALTSIIEKVARKKLSECL